MSETLINDIEGANSYPALEFDLLVPYTQDTSAQELKPSLTEHCLDQLNYMAQTALLNVIPEGTYPLFTYSRREAIEERHQRYLSQSIQRANGGTKKVSIVDEDRAASQVIDELSVNRHPVSQLVEQLRALYGSHIGNLATSDLVIEIVKHTAYGRFRNILSNQVASWAPEAQTEAPVRSGMKGRPQSPYRVVDGEVPKANGFKKSPRPKSKSNNDKLPRSAKPKKPSLRASSNTHAKHVPKTSGIEAKRIVRREGHKVIRKKSI